MDPPSTLFFITRSCRVFTQIPPALFYLVVLYFFFFSSPPVPLGGLVGALCGRGGCILGFFFPPPIFFFPRVVSIVDCSSALIWMPMSVLTCFCNRSPLAWFSFAGLHTCEVCPMYSMGHYRCRSLVRPALFSYCRRWNF